MNAKIEIALKNFLATRKDLFGVDSEFVKFRTDDAFPPSSNGFFSSTHFGRLAYKTDDGVVRLSSPLAVKIVNETGTLLEFYEMPAASNEVFFYAKILPFFEKFRSAARLFPRFYGHLSDTNCNTFTGVTVMENLRAQRYQPATCGQFLDYDHLALMMRKLAEFHGASYHAKKMDPGRFHCLASALANNHYTYALGYSSIAEGLLGPAARNLQEDPRYSGRLSDVQTFLADTRRALFDSLYEDRNDPTLVICHGDFGAHNFLFKYRDGKPADAKIMDLGNCRLASPAVDLAWLLFSNANRQMKTQRWDDLLDVYYAALAKNSPFEGLPSRESIARAVPQKSVMNCYAAATCAPFVEAIQGGKVEAKKNAVNSMQAVLEIGNMADPNLRLEILKDYLDKSMD